MATKSAPSRTMDTEPWAIVANGLQQCALAVEATANDKGHTLVDPHASHISFESKGIGTSYRGLND